MRISHASFSCSSLSLVSMYVKTRLFIYISLAFTLFLGGCQAKTGPKTASPTNEQDTVVPASSDVSEEKVNNGILFFGDSITAGYGIDSEKAFPALVQEKIDSLGWGFEVVPSGVSGETSAGGRERIDWVMHEGIDVLVLELGGNDGLRGVEPAETKRNLAKIIERARQIQPDLRVLLAGMQVPPNMGSAYTEKFKAVYPSLADEKGVVLIPFVLKGVGGVASLNQPDGIHPTAKGHKVIAETVWDYLQPVLAEVREGKANAAAEEG